MNVSVFSPAKINLFLAVTGRRADGFHDLVSVAAPLDFGDTLEAETVSSSPDRAKYSLECSDPTLAVDPTNLVLRAAAAFSAATGWRDGVHFRLTKRIPMGAGLGGGSSNAVAALRALNRLSGGAASEEALANLAAGLGSDCPMFLPDGPVIARGRGERIERLGGAARQRLGGARVLLFKPSVGVPTAWAYGRMAARQADYVPAEAAERRLQSWCAGQAPLADLLFNNFEGPVFDKYVALPALLGSWRREGRPALMTGSGSACFVLAGNDPVTTLTARIQAAWGEAAFVQTARIL
ncbi:MAG TPA: 4-(cytidine 5'-diphospho)-2-C-methyl-D-erythritol kinase [Candidatus Didemnitutus sp.]